MCPDRDILSAYFDGEIPAPWREAIAGHVASCASCAAQFARLERARLELQSEGGPDWRGPMERVRRAVLACAAARPPRLPLWRRTLAVPVPLAAAAAALVVAVSAALIGVSLRAPVGHVRITRAPAGTTEIQISAPAGDLEALLRSVGGEEGAQEEVITLPKNVILIPVGEPRMGKAAEFPRKKTW
jgi:anti-sigma factor RsiW